MSIRSLLSSPSTLHFRPKDLPFSPFSFSPQNLAPTQPTSLLSLTSSSSQPIVHVSPKRRSFDVFRAAAATPLSEDFSQTVDVQSGEEAPGNRILAQNVPWSSTADDLRPLFEKFGSVVEIELSMFSKNRNRGLAFVTMGSHEEALAALTNLESYEYEGRVLKLNWAKPKKKKPSSPPPVPKPKPVHNLFVANFPFQARAKDLKELFSSGDVNAVSAEVIFLQNPRRPAGYGFVSFNSKEEADAALSAFDGKEFRGRTIRVARSKRFLRGQTKVDIQSQSESNAEAESSESNAEAESSESNSEAE